MLAIDKARRCLAATLLLIVPIAVAVDSEPGPAGDLDGRIGALLQSRDGGGPGCSVSVVEDGRTLASQAFGQSNLETPEANTVETIYEAGSVSKQVTAAAVQMLAQQGQISLDDDIRRYVPEFPDYGKPITIRELLNHTSGLRSWDDLVELQGNVRGTHVATQDGVMRLLAHQRHLNFAPGTEFLYSNSNYVVAATIAARVSGMPFAEYTKRFLFDPIGMPNTLWRDDYTHVVPHRAQAYSKPDGGDWHLDMPFENVVGPGGLLTTVVDLQKWNDNLTTGRVGGIAFSEEMQHLGKLANGRQIDYALGLEKSTERGEVVISHAGATAGYRAYLARVPARSLSIALLCNNGTLNTEDLGPELLDLFLPAVMNSASATPEKIMAPAQDLQRRAGLYRNTRTREASTLQATQGEVVLDGRTHFTAVSSSEFRSARGTGLVFDSDREFRLLKLDGDVVSYILVKAWHPDAADLLRFVGLYSSDELGCQLQIKVSGQQLVLVFQDGRNIGLKPTYADAFEAPEEGWRLNFSPLGHNHAAALEISRTRTRNVLFKRIDARS